MERDNVAQLADRPKPGDSKWMDPRFLVAMLALIIGMVANYWSSHASDAARAAKNDAVLVNMTNQAQEMKNSQARIEGSVSAVASVASGLQSDVKALTRELDDVKRSGDMKDARIIVLEKAVSRMEGKGK